MRSWQDTGCWCLRCQNHQAPSPQASPQVRGVGCRERLRSVVLKTDELDGEEKLPAGLHRNAIGSEIVQHYRMQLPT